MYRIFVRNFTTSSYTIKHNVMKKHIQEKYKTGKQNNVFSYGKWFQSSQKPLTLIQIVIS